MRDNPKWAVQLVTLGLSQMSEKRVRRAYKHPFKFLLDGDWAIQADEGGYLRKAFSVDEGC